MSGYKLEPISLEAALPENASALFVIGGAGAIGDRMLYQIDRYIQNGGKIYFAVNSIDIDMSYSLAARKLEDKGLLAMLKSYGVEVSPALVLDAASQSVFTGTTIFPQPYPFYARILPEDGNGDHPLTAIFPGADVYWANPLVLKAPSGIEAVPLWTTTDNAWLVTKDFALDPSQAAMFASEYDATKGKKVLAAALSGEFPSYWRDKPKPAGGGDESGDLPDMPAKAAPSRIIVVGNAGSGYDFSMGNIDFLSNSFSPEQPNLEFIIKTANWLENDDDVIAIRNRAPFSGKLDKISDPADRAAAFSLARFVSMILIPAVVLVLGIALSYRRKKHSSHNADGGAPASVQSADKEASNAV
jgi:ABC-type uncharacterized transport system involved in gliding motility auxiliary subunit